ncbi:hypothetical protein OQA88_4561 [Cercophora sp. LCS_1]
MTRVKLSKVVDARKRGYELCKKGKLDAAEAGCKIAAELALDDPSPLSNLSSVKFELGQYNNAIEYILKSLELTDRLDPEEDRIRKNETLNERLIKRYMHEMRFGKARITIDKIADGALKRSVIQTLDALSQCSPPKDVKDAVSTRMAVLDRIPRFCAWLSDVAEYHAIGHDQTDSLVDEEFLSTSREMESAANFDGGKVPDRKLLYAFLLKICLPSKRPKHSDGPVHSPLNFTALLRLIAHLADTGYPPHWLSGVLSGLASGEIATTARTPKQIVTTPADVDATCPLLKMAAAPWRTEFTTLLSIWSRLMPFGLIAPPTALVPLAEIGEYTVSFPAFCEAGLRVPHFVLAFWIEEDAPPLPQNRLLEAMRDDDKADKSALSKEIRRKSVHVFGAVRYVTATRTASFWSRTDIMNKLQGGDWKVYICRIDTREKVTSGVKVRDGVIPQRLRTD